VKRILSLDGGGIKGVFSLQVLAAMEALFRREQGRDDLVLADVYHLFAGTSTGAIIATCLAWGMPVRDIEALYLTCGKEIFSRTRWYNRWKSKYRAEPITRLFRREFAETPGGTEPALLGSARLRTLLLVVMRNASTGGPWPVSNNPHAAYNDPALPDCNLRIPLWQLLRGSTAAPSYFPPERMQLGEKSFMFVDGAMTPFNNPTLMAVFMATLPAYGLCWPAGRQDLHVVSVGTCTTRAKLMKSPRDVTLLDAVQYLAPALIGAISDEQDYMCRVLGDCVHGAPLDSEVLSLDQPSLLSAEEQKFTYVRYDQSFDAAWGAELNVPRQESSLDDLRVMPLLQRMGQAYAAQHVQREHLFPRGGTG
jgi:hypothetical protein